jgi:hypothetical protein
MYIVICNSKWTMRYMDRRALSFRIGLSNHCTEEETISGPAPLEPNHVVHDESPQFEGRGLHGWGRYQVGVGVEEEGV